MITWHLMTNHFGDMREPYTAAATLLDMVLYFVLLGSVGRARGKYKVDAPSTDGPLAFRKFYRIQANTTEQLMFHLPLLWMAALSVGDMFAAVLALVWILGRLIYIRDYHRDPKGRHVGFLIGLLANVVLFVAVVAGVARSF